MMYNRTLISAIAASLVISVTALPNSLPNPSKGNFFRNPLDRRQTQTTPSDSPYATYGRLNPSYTKDQLNDIKLTYTEVDKLKYIRSLGDSDDYFKFDFTPEGFVSNAGNGLGGQGYLAQATNFPVLLNTGISMAIGYLNPCGLDSFHIHNRATEIVLLVAGKSLHTGFVLEDGFDQPVLTTIGLYQGTIRPQGSIHYEFNDNCEPAVFVAALSSEDPGVSRTSQNLFVEDPELIKAGLGYPEFLNKINVTEFYGSIPAAFAQGAKACYERCGLKWNGTTHA